MKTITLDWYNYSTLEEVSGTNVDRKTAYILIRMEASSPST